MSRNFKDLTGNGYGLLTVKCLSKNNHKHKNCWWICQCECGNFKEVRSAALNNGSVKSCGCKSSEWRGDAKRLRPYEGIYNRLVNFGKYPVHFTYEEFLEFTKINKCHYCYFPINWSKFRVTTKNQAYNLDRKDSNIDYTKENCAVCCGRCNVGKGNRYTYREWYRMTDPFRTGEL